MKNIYKLAADFETKLKFFQDRLNSDEDFDISPYEMEEDDFSEKDIDHIDNSIQIGKLFKSSPDEDITGFQEKTFNNKLLNLKEKLIQELDVLEEELMLLYNEFMPLDKKFKNFEINDIDIMLRSNDFMVKEIQIALDKHDFDSYEEAMGYLMALENEIEKLKKKIEKLENKT